MKPNNSLPLLALAMLAASVAAPVIAAPTVRDFSLPPGPGATPTASPTPQAQGPVNPDAPFTTRPQTAPTPSPSPSASATGAPPPARSQSPAQSPAQSPPAAAQPRSAPPAATTPVSGPSTTARPAPSDNAPAAAPSQAGDAFASEAGALPGPTSAPSSNAGPIASGPPAPALEAGESGSSVPLWGWLTGALALLGGIAAALGAWRRRDPSLQAPPQIELPLVNRHDDAPATPAPAPAPASAAPIPVRSPALSDAGNAALRIEATPSHLTRSMMAATFACRITLVNRGTAPLDNVTIGADLITAHSSIATEDQVSDPARLLPQVGAIGRIEPGESIELAQEVRLPTTQIRTLNQGKARLYVPLLRVRAQAGETPPVARTFIVGTLPQEGAQKLQPFRLDEMPQTYRQIGVAALD